MPYNMGKRGQESSGWQKIVYTGGICVGCVFQLGMTGRDEKLCFGHIFHVM
jgi:hypothetical protein